MSQENKVKLWQLSYSFFMMYTHMHPVFLYTNFIMNHEDLTYNSKRETKQTHRFSEFF